MMNCYRATFKQSFALKTERNPKVKKTYAHRKVQTCTFGEYCSQFPITPSHSTAKFQGGI